MSANLLRGAWVLSVLLAFFLGRFVLPREKRADAAGDPSAEMAREGGRDRNGAARNRGSNQEDHLRAHAVSGQTNEVLIGRMREVLNDPSPITRLPAWLRLLESARAEDMPGLLALIEKARAEGRYDVEESKALWARWGVLDGAGALGLLAEREDLRVGMDPFRAAQGWASQDPLGVLEWIEAHADGDYRSQMVKGAMKGWSEKDLDSATSHLLSEPEGTPVRSTSNMEALAWTAMHNRGLAGSTHWFRNIVNDPRANRDLKARCLGILLHELPRVHDVGAAAAFVGEHLDADYCDAAQVRAVVGAMRGDPARGIGFVDALGEEWIKENSAVIAPLVSNWLARDTVGPGQWLLQNPGSPAYDQVAADYALSIGSIDPEGAAKWCESIKDSDLRQRTRGQIGVAASP